MIPVSWIQLLVRIKFGLGEVEHQKVAYVEEDGWHHKNEAASSGKLVLGCSDLRSWSHYLPWSTRQTCCTFWCNHVDEVELKVIEEDIPFALMSLKFSIYCPHKVQENNRLIFFMAAKEAIVSSSYMWMSPHPRHWNPVFDRSLCWGMYHHCNNTNRYFIHFFNENLVPIRSLTGIAITLCTIKAKILFVFLFSFLLVFCFLFFCEIPTSLSQDDNRIYRSIICANTVTLIKGCEKHYNGKTIECDHHCKCSGTLNCQ